jgi:2-polyprenyl-3-methyl-5-hydroxy-6-metoxy-1,4-benzoquinol methylase
MPTGIELNDYYNHQYYEKSKMTNIKKFNREVIINKIKKDYNRFVKNNVKFDGKKILDVGAGRGFVLETIAANAKPVHLFGIEPSESLVAWVEQNKRYDYNIECYDIDAFLRSESKGYQNEWYDIIIFRSVLEHLDRPKQALIGLRALLKEGGLL